MILLAFTLDIAFLAVIFWKWKITSTAHYLTNHAVIDAEYDRTAYNILQEEVQHLNHQDKVSY
jgi:hypothetical protein